MSFARIAITLPRDVLAAVNRRARELGRPRSRVIVDALRDYLASPPPPAARPAYGADAFGVARRRQLEADLARSPAERLRAAEQAARLASSRRAGPRPRRGAVQQIIGFDSYEDFYEWKKKSRA